MADRHTIDYCVFYALIPKGIGAFLRVKRLLRMRYDATSSFPRDTMGVIICFRLNM